jgi:hypothetical protein
MAKKTIVIRNLAELLDVYRKTPPLFTDEAGKPDPNGSFIRLPDGKLSRRMAVNGRFTAPGTGSGHR